MQSTVNKLGLFALLKMLFVLFPIIGAVSFSLYAIVVYMGAHGLKSWTFLPVTMALWVMFYLARMLIFKDINKIKRIRKRYGR
jgi:uncharacterized protein with PQ loop repeat